MKLYIMRGFPGSGKTTAARKLIEELGDAILFSTDDFWTETLNHPELDFEEDMAKTYRENWNPKLLPYAHAWNYGKVIEAMWEKFPSIIVDNTNVTKWEVDRYANAAKDFGYEVEIKEPESEWWKEYRPMLFDKMRYAYQLVDFADILTSKTKHGVSAETIRKMINRWENIET